MKVIAIILFVSIVSCRNINQPPATTDTVFVRDTVFIDKDDAKKYENERFKDVTVESVGEHKFIVKGKAQVFEAAFSWVVEDGHNEIKEGHEMTDAGAPTFGNFAFVVDLVKPRANSTLIIILYEASAKDGSRQYQLPIPLY